MLTPEAQRPVHELIAQELPSRRRIDAADANMILTHALAGKSTHSLLALAYSVLTAKSKAVELLREHFFLLQVLRIDRPIYPENRSVSVLLRMAQFKLLAMKGESAEISACVGALLEEVNEEEEPQIRGLLESMAIAAVLNTIGIASHVPNWVQLLQRFKAKVDAEPVMQELKKSTDAASKQKESGTF